jgi:hypothetical protein
MSANRESPAPPSSGNGTVSRLVLYHGTSTYRLKSILQEKRLRVSDVSRKLALTPDRLVAEYWAQLAAGPWGDGLGARGQESKPVVLVLDGEGLALFNYDLKAYSDPCWGKGACDWENEIACYQDIDCLDEMLIAIEEAPEEHYREEVTSRLRFPAEFRLDLTTFLLDALDDKLITEKEADVVAKNLKRFHGALEALTLSIGRRRRDRE